jgi:hypothetical protein
MAIPHIIRTHPIRRAVLALADESSRRETSLTERGKSGKTDELFRLFGILHTRHKDAACAGVERESDKFRCVAGDPDEGDHGALGVVLDCADELDQEGCIEGCVFLYSRLRSLPHKFAGERGKEPTASMKQK